MRGQILNLVQALRDNKSPLELTRMPSITIELTKANRSAETAIPSSSASNQFKFTRLTTSHQEDRQINEINNINDENNEINNSAAINRNKNTNLNNDINNNSSTDKISFPLDKNDVLVKKNCGPFFRSW